MESTRSAFLLTHGLCMDAISIIADFLIDMQVRLQRAKADWSSRLEDFGHKISSSNHPTNGSSSTLNSNSRPKNAAALTPFRVLLQLFAYEDVLENHKLDVVFEADDGEALTFYVPQLLSFLLHGALYSSPQLEEWILDKCQRNVQFAHRCYWFLRSWCLEVPAESRTTSTTVSRRNSTNSLTNGIMTTTVQQPAPQQQQQVSEGLTPFLDEPAEPERTTTKKSRCRPPPVEQYTSKTSMLQQNTLSVDNDKFLPGERAMIERLMIRVKECGQIPAHALEFGTATTPVVTDPNNNNNRPSAGNYEEVGSPARPLIISTTNGAEQRRGKRDKKATAGMVRKIESGRSDSASPIPSFSLIDYADNDDYLNSPAAMVAAAESGKIPVDPGSGYPSVNHFCAMLSREAGYGFRSGKASSDRVATSPLKQSFGKHRMSETEQFDKTPQFLDALIFLAENLFLIPREERRETLRQQLRALECELLPSNSIYVPIGKSHHRVWRIVSEESIPISTKERVPCIVALEVIDYPPKRRIEPVSPWDLMLKMRTRAVSGEFSLSAAAPPTSLLSSTSMPDRLDVVDHLEVPDLEIVDEWRYGHRDPLRRVSLLDKVTTSVKIPFDKMKTQVRDHFIHLRDHGGACEEMQALSLAEYLVDPESLETIAAGNDRQDGISLSDADKGNAVKRNGTKGDEKTFARSLSRVNSAGSLTSLGQWSSPAAPFRTEGRRDKQQRRNLDELRARLDPELIESNPLLYGSDQEDDPSERKSQAQRPPKAQHSCSSSAVKDAAEKGVNSKAARPPPVVFRESWMSKQERVRQKSAFGDHPGWRLLAVLIKGNDDLRQEQLAAQLIQRMASILAREKVLVWICPYEIIATTDRGGVIEAIPDTISLDSLKKNDPNYTNLRDFFHSHFGEDTEELAGAKANFVESLAAYSMVCFLLQLKDRHNGNILLDKWGHIIHIDFGFFFLSSPGKNVGFESAPFKLTREFVELLDGPDSYLFRTFRNLCVKTFITLRRRCMEIILLVEMLKNGNEDLQCFRGRPDDAIQQLRERFRLDLNDRACKEYVNSLVDDSIENWRTDWYDRYQRYFVGVL